MGISYTVDMVFEANGEPEIKRACFYWSGDGPHCFDVTHVSFGPRGTFDVRLPSLNRDSYWLECYAEYTRDGVRRKTNGWALKFLLADSLYVRHELVEMLHYILRESSFVALGKAVKMEVDFVVGILKIHKRITLMYIIWSKRI
jgi:hypothetical protein